MKTQKGSMVLIGLIIGLVLLIISFLLLIEMTTQTEVPVIRNANETVDQVALQSNMNIKAAMELFAKDIADRQTTGVQGLFCTGGFIGTDDSDLKVIADTIVSNRIINRSPIEYATTQDEAGIVCLGSLENWVLFTALNQVGEEDTSHYWCIDSRGVQGSFGYNSETNQCLSDEII